MAYRIGAVVVFAVSLLLASVAMVALPQTADAQNPCQGVRIYVAQVEADPFSDWDGDGVSNIVEVNNGTPPCALPCNFLTVTDIQLNPRGDWDNDGVDNMSEHRNGFNPCVYEQYNIVPSNNRPSAPIVVTATAVPPAPTPVPAPTSTPVPAPTATPLPVATPTTVPTFLPTATVESVPVTPDAGSGDGAANAPTAEAAAATSTPGPTPTPLEGELAAARALLEDYDRAVEEAARATPTPQPTATPEPTATPDAAASSASDDADESDTTEVAADAPASASTGDAGSASGDGDSASESSGGVLIAVEEPCTAGFGLDGQCLKILPMTLVVVSAGAVVGSMWWFDRRKSRPEYPSLKLFD